MKKTGLTVGGFTQPSVAKSLLESPQAIERGLVQRFLWIFPKPTYSKFAKLQRTNQSFVEYLSKYLMIIILLSKLSESGYCIYKAQILSVIIQ